MRGLVRPVLDSGGVKRAMAGITGIIGACREISGQSAARYAKHWIDSHSGSHDVGYYESRVRLGTSLYTKTYAELYTERGAQALHGHLCCKGLARGKYQRMFEVTRTFDVYKSCILLLVNVGLLSAYEPNDGVFCYGRLSLFVGRWLCLRGFWLFFLIIMIVFYFRVREGENTPEFRNRRNING